MDIQRKIQFEKRFKQHYPRLCCIALGYVADRDDAEDIVQEAFINVWHKGLDGLSDEEFAPYMAKAVKNNCITFLRRQQQTLSIDEHPAAAGVLDDDSHDEETLSPSEMLERALAILPPKCREVFLMAKMQGMKYREIADALSLSEKTVENQMSKAIRLLRDFASAMPFAMVAVVTLVLSIILNCD